MGYLRIELQAPVVRIEPTDTRSQVKNSTTTVNLNFSILKISYYMK